MKMLQLQDIFPTISQAVEVNDTFDNLLAGPANTREENFNPICRLWIRIRIRMDPFHLAGSGSVLDDPDPGKFS